MNIISLINISNMKGFPNPWLMINGLSQETLHKYIE